MREDAGRVESGESEPKLRRRSSWRHFEPTPLGNEHVDWEHNPGAQQPAHHHRAGFGVPGAVRTVPGHCIDLADILGGDSYPAIIPSHPRSHLNGLASGSSGKIYWFKPHI